MKPSQRLGQHFLTDRRHAQRLAALVHCESDALCLEVGPGDGRVTVELAPVVPRLIAVELDVRWIPELRNRCAAFPHVEIIHDDILRFTPPAGQPLIVVGAIPYQITSPLLERLIGWKPRLRRAYLIMQREVAERLSAAPGTKAWGRLTCLVQFHFEVALRWHIPPGAFKPPPRVNSSVVELTARATPPCAVDDAPFFFAMIQQLFQQRRKTLWNALRSWDRLRLSAPQLRDRLSALRIAPTIRGETLSLADLARLANSLRPSWTLSDG